MRAKTSSDIIMLIKSIKQPALREYALTYWNHRRQPKFIDEPAFPANLEEEAGKLRTRIDFLNPRNGMGTTPTMMPEVPVHQRVKVNQ